MKESWLVPSYFLWTFSKWYLDNFKEDYHNYLYFAYLMRKYSNVKCQRIKINTSHYSPTTDYYYKLKATIPQSVMNIVDQMLKKKNVSLPFEAALFWMHQLQKFNKNKNVTEKSENKYSKHITGIITGHVCVFPHEKK